MKIDANLASKKQHRKQRENIGSRTLHGSILEGLGRLLGAIGALLGAMIAFLGRSWALLGRLFGLMGAAGLIWGGFGRLLGGSWEALGKLLAVSKRHLGSKTVIAKNFKRFFAKNIRRRARTCTRCARKVMNLLRPRPRRCTARTRS